ncbi:cysteine--tRNA ligase, cytoplasmic [Lepeophtheirus salmonis]|uniref:Cysteine--tRNA ligase, cytoplasmic n=1 Tax=Lepeophtheirus salmonis TaxID=72036 RepID=A0A0K2V4A0_LEPSM|nr:cysteine--tRNA ligase, cytoplasmic-like [Lepeophtheirus salmonis]
MTSRLIRFLPKGSISASVIVRGMAKRVQPTWIAPERRNGDTLMLYNSLTKKKEEFLPSGSSVTWYNCGPTVYDASHMGHARTYLTFDILRRVLSHYFGYNIFYVMNITDIDDKIIRRARQNHLYGEYVAKNHELSNIINDINDVLVYFAGVVEKTQDPDKKAMQKKQFESLSKLTEEVRAKIDKNETKECKEMLLKGAKDLLSDWLDSKMGQTVNDNEVFKDLPKYWEEMYHKDMDALNILPPDALTRVSEYVPEIVSFIQGIISRGYGYEAQGSVYFDVSKFDNASNHFYAKLVPESFGNNAALQEGEGDLSGDRSNEKKTNNDFALWKNSKPGEPSWDSPWGKGRPGWHIECSAMASELLGSSLDIHSGGCDLKFPHHDNELAQSEAFFDNDNWTKYFLHSGHLTIAGCKMSKSLKNFISIQDVLKTYTSRQLRLTFLLHSWKDTLDYSTGTMDMARNYEKIMNEYFLNVKHIIRSNSSANSSVSSSYQRWGIDEIELNNKLIECQSKVHSSFCDNVDTKSALDALKTYVSAVNFYVEKKRTSDSKFNSQVLRKGAEYITGIFKVVGLIPECGEMGFSSSSLSGGGSSEEFVMPYLNSLAEFRDNVRKKARELKATDILKECDRLRDDVLPDLGVRLEDKESEPTVIKLVDKEELLREKEQKKKLEEFKAIEKQNKKAAEDAKKAAAEAQNKIPPSEMFRKDTNKYSKFDEKGIPTHDVEGEEISKAQLKKLNKLYQVQEKKYTSYLESKNTK